MIENNIKNINVEHTIYANIGIFIFLCLEAYFIVEGIRITDKIIDANLKLFALIVIVIMFTRYLRVNFSMVYNSKDGGLIRYD